MKPRQFLRRAAYGAGVFALMGAPSSFASDIQFSCTTNGGGWTVEATAPASVPCVVGGGECTAMNYTITPRPGVSTPDHVAILVDHALTVEPIGSRTIALPCDGDSVSNIGIRDCSTQAVRMNEEGETRTYKMSVQGDAGVFSSSIVVKKGKQIEECGIASLALLASTCDPKAQQTSKETFTFDDCEVEITLNPCTGEPLTSTVVSGDCAVGSIAIDEIKLEINGVLQNVTVGEGWLSSGQDSCTTRWFNRQPYVTCSCTNVSDCLVKTNTSSGEECLCAGKGVCAGFPDNVCLQ